MNIRKMMTAVIAGASLLGLASVAPATIYDINIYGASAQYTFWNAAAPGFIQAQTGCSAVTPSTNTNGTTNKITYATCGGNTYNIRVSSKASFDGIYALLGNDSYATAGAANEKCSAGDPGDPVSNRAYYRKMAQQDGSLACEKITIGASDVAGESFTQGSSGDLKGPAEVANADYINRSFTGINTVSLPHANPFVVPFGFYVNTSVQQCQAGVAACTGYTVSGACIPNSACTPSTITNLSRMQAVLLFSGEIVNWQQFGSSFTDLPVVLCFRHAGSGTHATLDYAVVKGNGWGGTLANTENRPDDAVNGYNPTLPITYFNDGTPDEQYCLQNETGSVGYADADKANATTHLMASPYTSVELIQYQGEYPTADAIMHGRYDFWTNEWAYKDPNMSSTLLPLVNSLLSSVANQSNIPSAEANYWVVQSAMHFEKATDQQYPH